MKKQFFFVATLLSIATLAHAGTIQTSASAKVSKGDHFDCVPFPQNPTESAITGGPIVCTMSDSTIGPLARAKFVGAIDGHQVRWDSVVSANGTTWAVDRARRAALISVYGSGPQPTMRVVALSDLDLQQ